MTRLAQPWTGRALPLLAMLAMALIPCARAAEQPDVIPVDFGNGQDKGFGRIAMEPYVRAGEEPVAVQADITLRDLATLQRATNLLVAFNLHGRDVKLEAGNLTVNGKPAEPLRRETIQGGLQKQAFYAPADLLAAAGDADTLDLVLKGTVTARANGQWHVGALVIAFDAGWGTLRAVDGQPAELYGFSVVMAKGIPSGPFAPFHGGGNTWVALPLILFAFVASVAGGLAVAHAWHARPTALPAPTASPARIPASAPIPALRPAALPPQAPAPPPAPPAPAAAPAVREPAPRPVFEWVADPLPANPAQVVVPVFGTPASPPAEAATVAKAPPAAAGATLPPVQGPRMPAGFVPPPWSQVRPLSDGPRRRAPPSKTVRPVAPAVGPPARGRRRGTA